MATKHVYSYGAGKAEAKGKELSKDFLGGKGIGLMEMTSIGLPVPAGFTLDEVWLPGASPTFHRDGAWFTWRNFFLMGALELRDGSVGTPTSPNAPDIAALITPTTARTTNHRPKPLFGESTASPCPLLRLSPRPATLAAQRCAKTPAWPIP